MQKDVQRYLAQIRYARSLQICSQVRFVMLPAKASEEMKAWLREKKYPVETVSDNGLFCKALTKEQVDQLVQQFMKNKKTKMLTAPRMTIFNGQRAYISVGRNIPFYLQDIGADRKVRKYLFEGMLVDIDGTMSFDRTSATMKIKLLQADLVSKGNEPVYTKVSSDTLLTIPDDHAALICCGPQTRHKALGVQIRTGSNGEAGYHVVEKATPSPKPANVLWMLVGTNLVVPESKPASRDTSKTEARAFPIPAATNLSKQSPVPA